VNIPLDPKDWPQEWKTVFYKEYPRFPKIPLSDTDGKGELFETIRARTSRRDFSRRKLSLNELSALCKYTCGITGTSGEVQHRAQPSGGGRYPIEMYVLLFTGTDGVVPGVYHYNVKAHALDVLWERSFTDADTGELFTYPWAKQASLAVVLTGVFERNQMKYGERGYRHILIEAGAIVQNLYLVSTALGIKCCAIDGVHEPAIEKLIDIDGVSESAICSLVLG